MKQSRNITNWNTFDNVIRIGFLVIILYIFLIQMITNVLLEINGVLFNWTAFNWLFDVLMIFLGILIFLRWYHPLSNIFGGIYVLIVIYIWTRYLASELWYTMPVVFIIHFIFLGFLALNLFSFLKHFFNDRGKKIEIINTKNIFNNRLFRVFLLFFMIWIPISSWSYFGFSYEIEITDSGLNNDLAIDFYGLPFGGLDVDYYTSGECDTELEFYRNWNTTFIFGLNNITLLDEPTMDKFTQIIRKLAEFDIKVIIDIGVINFFADGTGPNGDAITYYYTKEVNDTLDLIVNYVKTQELSNFRGISMDIEKPSWKYDNFGNPQIPSYSQWAKAYQSYQNTLDNFKLLCPGNETFSIAIDSTLFDTYDDDYDIDVMQQTCSAPPQWDHYGYMTYLVGDPCGQYPFYYYMQQGLSRFGIAFMPWIGWIGTYDQLEKDPRNYQMMMDQIKIVKSLGIKEVVLAYSYPILGNYNDLEHREQIETTMFQRLNDINATRNDTFSSFNIPIHRSSLLYENLYQFFAKLTPSTFMSNQAVFLDLINELNLGWLMYFEIFLNIPLIILSKRYLEKSKKR